MAIEILSAFQNLFKVFSVLEAGPDARAGRAVVLAADE